MFASLSNILHLIGNLYKVTKLISLQLQQSSLQFTRCDLLGMIYHFVDQQNRHFQQCLYRISNFLRLEVKLSPPFSRKLDITRMPYIFRHLKETIVSNYSLNALIDRLLESFSKSIYCFILLSILGYYGFYSLVRTINGGPQAVKSFFKVFFLKV